MASLRWVWRAHQAKASEGRQRFVAVTVEQAATSSPPRINPAVVAPAASRVPTTSSQTVGDLERVATAGRVGRQRRAADKTAHGVVPQVVERMACAEAGDEAVALRGEVGAHPRARARHQTVAAS